MEARSITRASLDVCWLFNNPHCGASGPLRCLLKIDSDDVLTHFSAAAQSGPLWQRWHGATQLGDVYLNIRPRTKVLFSSWQRSVRAYVPAY